MGNMGLWLWIMVMVTVFMVEMVGMDCFSIETLIFVKLLSSSSFLKLLYLEKPSHVNRLAH